MYRCSVCKTPNEYVKPSPFDEHFGEGKCKKCGKKRTFIKDNVRRINGCDVVYEEDGYSIIHHPTGWMLYRGMRLYTFRTLEDAKASISRYKAWNTPQPTPKLPELVEWKDHEPPKPVARGRDIFTSWGAAESIDLQKLLKVQRAIFHLLRNLGPMTDEEIWGYIKGSWVEALTSPSGARTRRKELVNEGFVRDSGKTKPGRTNREMVLWEVIPRER